MSNKQDDKLIENFINAFNALLKVSPTLLSHNIFEKFVEKFPLLNLNDFKDISKELTLIFATHPDILIKPTENYAVQLTKLSKLQSGNFYSVQNNQCIVFPSESDRRFKDSQWHQNAYFNYIMQHYLLWVQWLNDIVNSLPNLDQDTLKKIHFFLKQFTDLMAPTNFFWLNPKIIDETLRTQGQNIIQGIANFLTDFDHQSGQLNISMVDKQAFKVGSNIAETPGQVVFRNDLIELICYKPSTPQVYNIPLIIVPPCINKFYIFDLGPEKSFVKWCRDQGIVVYIISWVNPGQRLSYKTYEDYVIEGAQTALHHVLKIAEVKKTNMLGFCIGGNILNSLSAYLTHLNSHDNPINSTTYLATLFDFDKAGDMRLFLNQEQIDILEKKSQKEGYISGQMLAHNFNLMRANDLIWSFMINNYFLGKSPKAVDFLYWNADSTTLSSTMYIEYLNKFFLKNCVINAETLSIKGITLNFEKIVTPTYVLSTKEDHIAPWESGYVATQIFKENCQFVLGGSGHIAGVFNPPENMKYSFWSSQIKTKTAEAWFETAVEQTGSWWNHWLSWLKPLSGALVDCDHLNLNQDYNLGKAPGSYVNSVVNTTAS